MGVARRSATTTKSASSKYEAPEDTDTDDDLVDEDEDATPRRSSSVPRRGWGAAKKTIKENSTATYANDWTPPAGSTLIKFIEDEPFFSIGSHWVDEIHKGKRSFYCLEEEDPEGCPLCGVGHRASAQVYFNVVPLASDDSDVELNELKALKAGPMLADIIQQESDGRSGPLSRHFWVLKKTVTKSGSSNKTNYSLTAVKARDLAEDWEVDPDDTQGVLENIEPYGEDIFTISSRADLVKIVNEFLLDD